LSLAAAYHHLVDAKEDKSSSFSLHPSSSEARAGLK